MRSVDTRTWGLWQRGLEGTIWVPVSEEQGPKRQERGSSAKTRPRKRRHEARAGMGWTQPSPEAQTLSSRAFESLTFPACPALPVILMSSGVTRTGLLLWAAWPKDAHGVWVTLDQRMLGTQHKAKAFGGASQGGIPSLLVRSVP